MMRLMRVRRLCWLGVRTDSYGETVRLFRDVLGLHVRFEESATVEFSSPGDDRVQIFGPGHPYRDFLAAQAPGPVPLFEVEDVAAARAELEAAGVELVGQTDRDDEWEWFHFRGPDWNLYPLGSRRGE